MTRHRISVLVLYTRLKKREGVGLLEGVCGGGSGGGGGGSGGGSDGGGG